jgi:hypothetical protein
LLSVIADGSKKPAQRQFDLTTQAGINAWDAKFAATSYVAKTTSTQRDFELRADTDKQSMVDKLSEEIASSYGDLKLDKTKLDKISNQALRKGYTLGSVSLDHLVYLEASSTPSADEPGKTNLDTGSETTRLKKIASDYAYEPSDLSEQIKSILTGSTYNGVVWSENTLLNEAKRGAVGMYGHLKDRIDAGSSLADIFSGYKNKIASVLELDPNSVTMNNSDYAKFLGTPESGQYSLSAMEAELKTNKKYKYEYTKKANKDATSIAGSLARMFGEIK